MIDPSSFTKSSHFLLWTPNFFFSISLYSLSLSRSAMQPQARRGKASTAMPPQQPTVPAHLKELVWPDSPPQPKMPTNDSSGSSLRSGAAEKPGSPPSRGGGTAVVAVETYYSPLQSPLPVTPPTDSNTPENNLALTTTSSSLVLSLGRIVTEKATSSALVVGETAGVFGFRKWKKKKNKENEGVVEEIVSRSRFKDLVMKAALGLRVYEFVLALVSFAVMAADNTQGWSGDSFCRYKEYRYCLSVNVIAFAYAAFQAFNLTYNMLSGKQFIKHHLHHQFDFIMDQILAYLLISASSAAATRVDEWQSNWGKDEFTEKASISASMSFLVFIGFAFSSVISGHNLCNRDFT